MLCLCWRWARTCRVWGCSEWQDVAVGCGALPCPAEQRRHGHFACTGPGFPGVFILYQPPKGLGSCLQKRHKHGCVKHADGIGREPHPQQCPPELPAPAELLQAFLPRGIP